MKMEWRSLLILAVILGSVGLLVWLDRTAPTPTDIQVMDYAEEKGVAYTDYPRSLIMLMHRNPETRDFVLNYPFREEKAVDLSGYDPDQVPLFLQWDSQWGYLPYGEDFVAVSGSGPMCLAMAGWYLSGGAEVFAPDRVVEYARQQGYDSGKNGVHWQLITQGSAGLGLKATGISLVQRKIEGYLGRGEPIIAMMEAGDFGTANSYILLTGWEDGKLRLCDPGSRENSQILWDYDTVAGQIKNLWVIHRRTEGNP